MMVARKYLFAAVLGLAGWTGCGPQPEPRSPLPDAGPNPAEVAAEPSTPWSKCYEFFAPSGDPAVDVAAMGRMCGLPNQQHPITAVRDGKQTEADAVDRFTVSVGGPKKCYRFFANGDTGIRDLDVQVLGPNGEPLATDGSKDAYPVVPPREPLCLPKQGIYTVEVGVGRGAGKYTVQVWGN